MFKNLKIALVQFSITHLRADINLARAESYIKQAAEQGARVIVFPEDFMTSSIFGDLTRLDRDNTFLKQFQALAKKHNIDIVSGSWMEETPNGAKSTASYIDATGAVLGQYYKNHLYLSERHFLTPGTEVSVFDTKYGKAGLIICWDIMFPEIFTRMNALGVQIVYCPSYWYKEIAGKGLEYNSKAEEQHLDALCLARAVENNIAFIYVNAAGVATFPNGSSDHLVGHSQITLPIAGTVAKLNHNAEGMIIMDVNLSLLDIAAKTYRLRTE
ncbi:MAG: carbon-nitrogen hydrolase family protein [Candidatus Magasanikbacteria bacterium]|nr:carbon-nitrogen hydrolase family protein [Candidatus Magasanikbacteria bacterium]